MLSTIGSTLVAGSTVAHMATKHVQVTRAFFFKGGVQVVGSILELESRFAVELIANNKAIATDPPKLEEVTQSEPESETPRARRKRDAE